MGNAAHQNSIRFILVTSYKFVINTNYWRRVNRSEELVIRSTNLKTKRPCVSSIKLPEIVEVLYYSFSMKRLDSNYYRKISIRYHHKLRVYILYVRLCNCNRSTTLLKWPTGYKKSVQEKNENNF